MATLYWASWVASITFQIRLALVENIGMELSEKRALARAVAAKLILIQQISDPFMVS